MCPVSKIATTDDLSNLTFNKSCLNCLYFPNNTYIFTISKWGIDAMLGMSSSFIVVGKSNLSIKSIIYFQVSFYSCSFFSKISAIRKEKEMWLKHTFCTRKRARDCFPV